METKHPQSIAETIGKYSCLAMCYLFCVGIDGTDGDYIRYIIDAMDKGLLDGECTVLDAEKYLGAFTGKRWTVTKKVCIDISKIKNPTPVRYDYCGLSHWVVVENGEIVFNSLSKSNCVNKGRPTTMRVIELSK